MGDRIVTEVSSFSNAFNSKSLLLLDNKPNSEFWLKDVTIPSISLNVIETEHQPYTIKNPGTNITYGDLSVTVFLDEDFQVYKELYNWLYNSLPTEEFNNPKTDATIMIFSNSMTKIITKFRFKGIFLTGLPNLSYDNFGTTPLTMGLTLPYDDFIPEFDLTL